MWLPSGLSGTHFNINNLPGKGILSRPPGAAGIIINSGFVSQGEVPLCKARALDQESEVLGPCLGLGHGTANPTEWLQADPLHIPRPLSSLQSAQARKLCEHFPLPSRASCCAHCSVVSDSLPPHDCSSPGPSVHGILQARIWSGLPFPSPGDLPGPGIKPSSPALTGGPLPLVPPQIVSTQQVRLAADCWRCASHTPAHTRLTLQKEVLSQVLLWTDEK